MERASTSSRSFASVLRPVAALLLVSALTAGAATLWVAESEGTLKISVLDGAFLLEVPEEPYGTGVVGIDATNGNVWTYGERRLRAFDRDGEIFLDISSPQLPEWNANIDMAVDGDAGNVWLLLGPKVRRFNLQGAEVGLFDTHSPYARMTLDRSRATLWVSGSWDLRAFDAQFEQSLFIDFGSLEICAIEWDPYRGELWVAAGDKLRRYNHLGQMTAEMPNPNGFLNTNFMSPDGAGGLWIASATQALHVDSAGAVSAPLTPFPDFSSLTIVDLVASPVDQTVWIANETHLRRFSTSGAQLQELHLVLADNVERSVQHVSLSADLTPPTLAFVTPTNSSSTSNPRPTLRVNYLDAGSGVEPESLAFTLNGASLAVTCTSDAGSAECQPEAPLPDGVKNVSAVVSDAEGNESEPATVTFTLDTQAPQITVTSPLQDAFVNVASQSISGSLNETATLTMNGQNTAVNASQAFTAAAALIEGLNSFVLAATDAAGNSASITRRLTLDTAAPATPVASQISASVGAGVLTINGSAGASEPGATVVITNLRTGGSVSVLAQASGAFTAQLVGQAGDPLQVRAVDLAGNQGGSITVSTGAATLVLSVAAPVDGATVADRRVLVTGSVSGGENIGVAINRQAVATTVNGAVTNFASLVALEPGANSIEIVATDIEGHSSSRNLAVTRTAQTPYSATVSPDYGIAPHAVEFEVLQYSQTSPAQIEVDFEGDGEFDAVSDSIDTPVTFTYETAGAFLARVRVTDPDDTEYEYLLPVVIKSSAQIDAEARATWTQFLAALNAGDATAALQLMTVPGAQRFFSVFAILGPDLPQIAATFSLPQSVTVTPEYAEYAVTREIAGVQRVFLVGLLREADGTWRIDSM